MGLLLSCLALAACGGGGSDGPSVNNLTATNALFGRTMTLTVSGSGLDTPDLALEVDGPCKDPTRTVSTLDYQAAFTCTVEGIGRLDARVRDAMGEELGRIRVAVPTPQVSFTVAQGDRSGSFTVELDPVAAPVTALNFVRYVNAGFYSGKIFHRVLPGRIAQGGQYDAQRTLRPALFDPIALESDNGLQNLRGTIAMARTSEPDSATAQFYLNLIDNPDFDYKDADLPGYAVFGRVVEGLDVVDEIGRVPVVNVSGTFPSLPAENVLMTRVTQTR
jgi:peptidyl-prolyl cis-trans isomerase A (cyclophilin A)